MIEESHFHVCVNGVLLFKICNRLEFYIMILLFISFINLFVNVNYKYQFCFVSDGDISMSSLLV
jgi:hypothetical protein